MRHTKVLGIREDRWIDGKRDKDRLRKAGEVWARLGEHLDDRHRERLEEEREMYGLAIGRVRAWVGIIEFGRLEFGEVALMELRKDLWTIDRINARRLERIEREAADFS